MKQAGLQLEELCNHARHEVLLAAPFIKLNTFDRLLKSIDQNIKVRCVTRWHPDEIVAGVSDLDVWLLVKERPHTTLWLRSDLHAKYYRGDQRVLVGSANLTNAALGWSRRANLELLISSDVLTDFEQELFAGSVIVDDSLYKHVKQIVEALPAISKLEPVDISPVLLDEDNIPPVPLEAWLPLLRHPEKLYTAYAGDIDQLGIGSRVAALHDLQAFDTPAGLNREQFEAYVGIQLLQKPIIRQVDQFVETPQRFGAVRDFLKSLPCSAQKGFDSNIAWQTLMRWLTHFISPRYIVKIARHSEVISRS